jgi:hypothetical protein
MWHGEDRIREAAPVRRYIVLMCSSQQVDPQVCCGCPGAVVLKVGEGLGFLDDLRRRKG